MGFYPATPGAVASMSCDNTSGSSATPVTSADLAFIADTSPTAPSPYKGVYWEKSGWVAKAFKRRVASPQETPRLAAELLVRWWKQKYGSRWKAVWHYRQTQGWTALKCSRGVWALAELRGEAVVLVGVGPDGKPAEAASTPGCKPFKSKAKAAKGVQAWARSMWGDDACFVLRRTWAEGVNRNRVTPIPK